jgi:dihydrodipicolinate synthase/N-acetylneuraminate lyase
LKTGVAGFYLCGSTGEGLNSSVEEREVSHLAEILTVMT